MSSYSDKFNKVPYIYKPGEVIDYKKENVNHRFLERNVYNHNHDGINGKELEDVYIKGTLTTDDIQINKKSGTIFNIFKCYDTGWQFPDVVIPTPPNPWWGGSYIPTLEEKKFYALTGGMEYMAYFNHDLNKQPLLAFIYNSIDGGTNYTDTHDGWNTTLGSTPTCGVIKLHEVGSTQFKIKIGRSALTKYYRVILLG